MSDLIRFEDGMIVTDLSDLTFLEYMMRLWGGMSESDINVVAQEYDVQKLSEDWLRSEGFIITRKEDPMGSICLTKVDTRKWLLKDCSEKIMGDIVGSLK